MFLTIPSYHFWLSAVQLKRRFFFDMISENEIQISSICRWRATLKLEKQVTKDGDLSGDAQRLAIGDRLMGYSHDRHLIHL